MSGSSRQGSAHSQVSGAHRRTRAHPDHRDHLDHAPLAHGYRHAPASHGPALARGLEGAADDDHPSHRPSHLARAADDSNEAAGRNSAATECSTRNCSNPNHTGSNLAHSRKGNGQRYTHRIGSKCRPRKVRKQ